MQPESGTPEPDTTGSVVTRTVLSGVARELNDLLADVEDVIKSTTSLTAEDLARVKARLAAGIASARRSIEAVSSSVAQQARATAETTDAYVHDKPWQAAGIAAGIGLLVGMALARRG